jgi:hypothetical protein
LQVADSVLCLVWCAQGLLSDWQSLSQQVSSLSDQAARRFDEQQQATQNMAALLSSTMATIADATTLAKRLQEKYVQQTLQMQAGGDDAIWSCNRTTKLLAHFSFARCAPGSCYICVTCTCSMLARITLRMQHAAVSAVEVSMNYSRCTGKSTIPCCSRLQGGCQQQLSFKQQQCWC